MAKRERENLVGSHSSLLLIELTGSHVTNVLILPRSSLVMQRVKDPALSLLWLEFDPCLGISTCRGWSKKNNQNKNRKRNELFSVSKLVNKTLHSFSCLLVAGHLRSWGRGPVPTFSYLNTHLGFLGSKPQHKVDFLPYLGKMSSRPECPGLGPGPDTYLGEECLSSNFSF